MFCESGTICFAVYIFKTLVLHGDKSGYFVCVIPGEHEVDLKLAAKLRAIKRGN